MKKITLSLLIFLGVFAISDTIAQSAGTSSAGSGSSSTYREDVSPSDAPIILEHACGYFELCYEDMYNEYRIGLVLIEKVGEDSFEVTYGGGSVLVLISGSEF